MVKQVRDKIFFDFYHKIIDLLLARGAKVIIACSPDEPNVIYGALVYEPTPFPDHEKEGVLHWVYVKSTWRRLGVATRLFEQSGLDPNKCFFTHWTNSELAINAKREVAKRGLTADWKTIREVKAKMVAEREAKGQMEGDTRVLITKYPGLTYCPFLIGTWAK